VNLEELFARVDRLERRLAVSEARVVELEAEVLTLRTENQLLRVENAALKEQLRQRDEKIARLEAEIEDLRMQLRQNSQNSSKPPSSDPPWKKPTPKDPPSGRKPGGQKGHKGEYRQLWPAEEVDHFHDYPAPEQCRHCAHDLKGVTPEEPIRMQVTELPEVKAVVHEHRAEVVCCPNCGKRNNGSFPKEVERPFGPRLLATIALLSGAYRLSKRNVQGILSQLWKIPLSLGAVSNSEGVVAEALKQPMEEALAFVQQQPVVGADETGWKQGLCQAWLWVATTPLVSVFLIQTRRTAQAAQTLLGKFSGVLTVDRFGGYRWFKGLRQFCWAHLKRDFRAISEFEGPGQAIGKSLLEQTGQLFRLINLVRDGTMSVDVFQSDMKSVQARVEALLAEGRQSACKVTRGKCKTLWKERHCLWTFVRWPLLVPPTNNQSEQDLRHAVILRKTSFRTQSDRGSRFIERMLTVVKSLKAQNRNVLDFLIAALETRNLGTPAPSLLPSAPAQ
jgi:transposase